MIFKIIITIIGIVFWVVLLPVTIALSSFMITHTTYTIPSILYMTTGIVLASSGLLISLCTVLWQITYGKGTPIPVFGPQKLIVTGPYKYCRNPMTLGLLLYYSGAGFIVNDFITTVILLLIVVAHMIYDKYFEERELTQKFGNEYLHYKQNTPFILPKLRK